MYDYYSVMLETGQSTLTMMLTLDAYSADENVAGGAWALLAPAVGIYRSTTEGAAGGKGGGDEDGGGGAGPQGRPFPTFAMSYCNRDGSEVHCLARSEVQVVQILFLTVRADRLQVEYKNQQIRKTYVCFFSVAKI